MNPDPLPTACDVLRNDLLRVACDDALEASSELNAHLVACERCRAALAESRAVVAAVQSALEPQPLSAQFRARIAERLARPHRATPHSLWSVPARIGLAAAAAGLLLVAFLWPAEHSRSDTSTRGDGASDSLAPDEALAIVSAYATLRWDDPCQYALENLAHQTARIAESVEPGAESTGCLPWNRDDDWDTPLTATNGSSARPARQTQA